MTMRIAGLVLAVAAIGAVAIGVAHADSAGVGTGGYRGPSGSSAGAGLFADGGSIGQCTVSTNGILFCPVVTATLFDGGSEWVHGPLRMSGTGVSDFVINPNVDSNFVYFQGANMRASAEWRFDFPSTFANTIKLTDANTYSTVVDAPTPPTVANGCTGEAMTWNAGSASFRFDVGTTCAGVTSTVITFPTATTNCYTCACFNITSDATLQQAFGGCSTTTFTISNRTRATQAATDYVDGNDIQCMCRGG